MPTLASLWRRDVVRNAAGSAIILLLVSAMLWLGGLRVVDDVLDRLRFQAVQRAASQSLTIVEIDARSLEAVGSWPWQRERYAEIIDRLIADGATLVAFDVDFSASSDGGSDGALAQALSRHPGQVALGTFQQKESYVGGHDGLVENTPIAPLIPDALVASVNVPVDEDGTVRRYAFDSLSGLHASVASLLAGATRSGEFAIDYGIDRHTIPHLSFDDVLHGRIDPSLVNGKVILIGATALELGDEFATPVGLIPGVVIHGLAYESIVGGRALMTLHPWVVFLLCGCLCLGLFPRRSGGAGIRRLLIAHVLVLVAIFGLPVLIQQIMPVSVQTGPLLATQILLAVWATQIELLRRGRAIVQEREAGLLHLALHQPETELPNRRALLQAIADHRQDAEPVSVITVGVERHAEMRGVVGYNVANQLIVQLAQRLAQISQAPCVAHISSSVLAFSMRGLTPDDLTALLARLQALETNFHVGAHSIDLYLRTGAAAETSQTLSPEVLLERATLALSEARKSTGRIAVYDEVRYGSPANNLALMTEMLDAISSGDISLHYQPKMRTSDGAVTSVEALCRWRHPTRGAVYPDVFIPIAEETGQIRELTEWSFVQAIKDQARLRAAGQDVTIALNISGRLLGDENFKQKVLEFAGSVDTRLCLEITETAVIDHPEMATAAISAFRDAGLKISIDDYGSGLSSLSYLKLLNADELKVDKSLVTEVHQNQRDKLIMKSTIDLAHGLGMSVVAEGVEDQPLADCLTAMGCDVLQGYWLSKPLPLPQLIAFLDERAFAAVPLTETRAA